MFFIIFFLHFFGTFCPIFILLTFPPMIIHIKFIGINTIYVFVNTRNLIKPSKINFSFRIFQRVSTLRP